jgi:hypothetical protein
VTAIWGEVQPPAAHRRQHATDDGSHLGVVVDDQDIEFAKALGGHDRLAVACAAN